MIERAERDRIIVALVGAFIIHALAFLGIQFLHPHATLPTTPLPVFVDLSAPTSSVITSPQQKTTAAAVRGPSAAAPRESAPSSTTPTPSHAPRSAAKSRPAAAPATEYDPLAGPPVPQTKSIAAAPAPQPSFSPAPVGPTAAERARLAQQQEQLKQWQESHPLDTSPPPDVSAQGSAAPAQSATSNSVDKGLERTIDQTMNAIASAEKNQKNGSSPAQTQSSSARGAASSTGDRPSAGYSDSRLRFSSGRPRGLISKGRLSLDEKIVRQILSRHPDHPPKILVPVEFDVGPNGFVTNLKLLRSSGYTQLDQEIENLFNGQVFVSAPGAPIAHGAIEYVIVTQ